MATAYFVFAVLVCLFALGFVIEAVQCCREWFANDDT